jgi:glycosyltransferase involved in cell wall biosynthesis
MKILFLISNYPHKYDPVSGIFYKRIIQELHSRNINIYVIVPRNFIKYTIQKINFKKPKKQFSEEKSNSKITIYRPFYIPVPQFISKKLKVNFLFLSVLSCIKKNKLTFDLVDSRYAFPWSFIGMKISKKFNTPYLTTVVGDDINLDIHKSEYIRNCVFETLKSAHKVICVSTPLQAEVYRNFRLMNTEVIYDGINFKNFEQIKQFKNSKVINSEKLNIGYVGHISEGKGALILLEIITKTKEKYNWIIIGDGPLKYIFNGKQNVHLLGNLEPTEVLNYYSDFDIFIFPSLNEGIPNVLKEASYFGIPIISSAVGGIPEMTCSGEFANLIDEYKNTEKYIDKIEEFERDKYAFKEKANKLKPYVISHFDLISSTDKLIILYNSALKSYSS